MRVGIVEALALCMFQATAYRREYNGVDGLSSALTVKDLSITRGQPIGCNLFCSSFLATSGHLVLLLLRVLLTALVEGAIMLEY